MSRYRYEDNIEWKVLRNGELWSDRFDSEDECIEYINECVKRGLGESQDYTYELMTDADYEQYK